MLAFWNRTQMTQIGIIAALRLEAPRVPPGRAGAVLVVVSGIGRRRAGVAAQSLLAVVGSRPACLVSWGICGAVAADLQPGDLFLAEAVAWQGEILSLAGPWLAEVKGVARPFKLHTGLLQTCDRPVVSRLGLQSGVSAVDMEAFAVAQVARAAGLPALAIKAVSDRVPVVTTPSSLLSWSRTLRTGARLAAATLHAFAGQWFA